MAEHDPADVEYMARLIAVACGYDPNSIRALSDQENLSSWYNRAIRALDYLQKRGEKVASRYSDLTCTGIPSEKFRTWHDAAPLTPRD